MTFITFEGGDGSGKTSQTQMLHDFFISQNIKSVLTKEPGGTPLANQIRQLLLSQEIQDPATEFALLTAARRDHVLNFIQPHLDRGIIVICDRFLDSSIVYQGIVKGLDTNHMMKIHHDLVGNLKPDITFLLDIDPNVSIKRLNDNNRILNHYDSQALGFHKNIRNAFLHVASQSVNRVIVIDASRSIDEIHSEVALHAKHYLANHKNSDYLAIQSGAVNPNSVTSIN